jgi:hypothetical protein
VVIRPTRFIKTRIEYSELLPLLEKAAVQYPSLEFPHVPRYEPEVSGLRRDLEWVGYEFEFANFIEAWRFYMSGQFAHHAAMWMDLRDLAGGRVGKDWKPGVGLGITETVLRFSEIFELASRLSLTSAGDEQMHIETHVCNLRGRILINDNPRRASLPRTYKSTISEFPDVTVLPKTDLIAKHKELALQSSKGLFSRFGWSPPIELLQSIQSD